VGLLARIVSALKTSPAQGGAIKSEKVTEAVIFNFCGNFEIGGISS
jgi:hypothetical protein